MRLGVVDNLGNLLTTEKVQDFFYGKFYNLIFVDDLSGYIDELRLRNPEKVKEIFRDQFNNLHGEHTVKQ